MPSLFCKCYRLSLHVVLNTPNTTQLIWRNITIQKMHQVNSVQILNIVKDISWLFLGTNYVYKAACFNKSRQIKNYTLS